MSKPQKQTATIAPKTDLTGAPKLQVAGSLGRLTPVELARKVAQSKIVFLRWKIPGMDLFFPHDRLMLQVDKYFPQAVGGALFVDEPQFPAEVTKCEKKRVAMKELGHRYLVVTKTTDEYAANAQLGGRRGMDDVA